ncbi:hypothetical protein AVEN_191441-1 [Araneus ventricosus]|uniref:DUF4817 domain-containing protein n=1 Tax=Araneus ventricosus TaxID=182803 RepID=A0A4Y2M6P6_ARAVE|nr:hypothetical protein AVEN_191441-1 [Araneus ventricosus]
MWFQHDGAPPHFSLYVQSALDAKFPGQWIGRDGPTHCPARSTDLSYLDFFLWGHLKILVYESPIYFDEDLVGFLLLAAPSEKCRVCLRKCTARYVAGVTPAGGRSSEQFLEFCHTRCR